MRRSRRRIKIVSVFCVLSVVACGRSNPGAPSRAMPTAIAGKAGTPPTSERPDTLVSTTVRTPARGVPAALAGMPPVLDPHDIYAADRANQLSPVVRNFRSLVYVPNSQSDTVDVIDPTTYRIVAHFAVGALPQHVVPAWDLKTLYVTNDQGNSLTPINPATGQPGPAIPVEDPYNMYFTPDGKDAIVVSEGLERLDFRDAHTFKLANSLHLDCLGIDHLDFSGSGTYLIASCEFSGRIVKVDVETHHVIAIQTLNSGNAKPQDVKVDPTGHTFYVADANRGGVYVVNGDTFAVTGFVSTGAGAHGLYVSRDSKVLYVTNRAAGTISLLQFATSTVTKTWVIPGGSPDMGGLSADGTKLWISGRYNDAVYVIDTTTGALLHTINVGAGPHGLCVYPQPGRYSLGHTGIFR